MEEFVRGDVVIVPFPFSDLSTVKRRPALVIANFQGPDIILCQITSKKKYDSLSIGLAKEDFTRGGLAVDSFVRPNRIFTAEKSIIQYRAGTINEEKLKEVKSVLISLLEGKL